MTGLTSLLQNSSSTPAAALHPTTEHLSQSETMATRHKVERPRSHQTNQRRRLSSSATQCVTLDTDLELINKTDADVSAGRGGSPDVCRNAESGRGGGRRGLSGAQKHLDRFRQRSEERLLAGHAEEGPRDTSKCRQTSPPPQPPPRGKTRGET